MKNYIDISIFDLFKIGPGPSSSHTIGPMKAGYDFFCRLNHDYKDFYQQADQIDVFLYGSLSATGKGHGTDKSVTAGLLGKTPENCDPEFVKQLLPTKSSVNIIRCGDNEIKFRAKNIHFEKVQHSFPYQNTMIIRLTKKNDVLLEKEYYSIGGGFIKIKGEKEQKPPRPPYLYNNMSQLKQILKERKISLKTLILANERAVSGLSDKDIFLQLKKIINTMVASVEKGLETEGLLPGPIKLQRKAKSLFKKVSNNHHIPGHFFILINAYSLAASEENADGQKVVTAPTSGSAGVIPGLVYLMLNNLKISRKKIAEAFLAAAAIGFIAKHNASISGAEVGCQGEIGVASAMGAALLAYVHKYPIRIIENAAEIALEYQLGMTCDPVKGYVQIPCIERNAMGAITAYNAFLLATSGDAKKQKINFDEVVEAMLETGRDMSNKYKETSTGGLAVCSIFC